MYCRVSPFQGTFDGNGLIYFIPESNQSRLQIGQLVDIPLKNSIQMAVVLQILSVAPTDIPLDKIKSLIQTTPEGVCILSYQCQIIDYISQQYITPIHNAAGVFFPRNLREKIGKQTIHKITPTDYIYQYNTSSELTKAQEKALGEIQASANKKILLYGVTGSGKTEIYREIIQKNIEQGKQTLLLIPEIILGSQIGERIRNIFGSQVLILSSNVTEAKKTQYWIDIESGNAQVIIGTRSALFYPYSNLGQIIVDEEHDNSYVSDSAPRYSSLDIVSEMSRLLDIPIILGSGTPSIESMYRAMRGEYQLVTLLEKYS